MRCQEETNVTDAAPLTEAVTVRFDHSSMTQILAIALESSRTPAALVRKWALERLNVATGPQSSEPFDAVVDPRDQSIERLRRRYRPDDIVVLFVAESAPAGGSFFYQADSNLFFATREACELAFGSVPQGRDFLRWFQARGFWLYDLAKRPVNRQRGRPRKLAVSAGVAELADLIAEAEPDFVVAVKTSIESDVRQAADRAGLRGNRILVLPFPLYQWRDVYVRELARFFGHEDRERKAGAPGALPGSPASSQSTLHEAMVDVLENLGGGPVPAREIANEIAARGLYARRDGGRADYQQILARARKYPRLFAVDRLGLRLT
jgi:hypothetical protein